MKNVFYFILKALDFRDIQIFVIFSLPFHTFQNPKGQMEVD